MSRDNSRSFETPGVDIALSEENAIACVYGRIDIDSSPAVRSRLLALLEAPHPPIVSIDLAAVMHIDSSGVATLIEALRIAQSHNTEVRLQGLEGRLLHLFQSTGILSLFNGSTRANTQSGSKAV